MLRLLRNILSDKKDDFTFRAFNNSLNIDPCMNSGLYIHIPFCINSCPYCPYFKITYDSGLADAYKTALINEIKQYKQLYGTLNFCSLYIGGGTPTLMIKELQEIISAVNESFIITEDYAVEVSPCDIDIEKLDLFKQMGFNLISIGIQSFNQKYLELIGRTYNRSTAVDSLSLLMNSGFETINTDLIFAYPGQTIQEVQDDLIKAVSFDVDQITCYPLFTFPYTEVGRLKKIKKLKMPNQFQRRNLYYYINEYLLNRGYIRTNVWSFSKKEKSEFSSVTRDYYLGLGASSGSYNGDTFYFNTFSVSEYINSVKSKLPISIAMKVSKKLEKNFWFYWQLYTTVIDKKRYFEMFDTEINNDFGFILRLFKLLNFTDSVSDQYIRLNTKGSHWIHLAQNYYALNYVNKVWDKAKHDPWPEKIKL